MSDLIAFLRARLDEDEQTARDGEEACWHVDYCDGLGSAFHERFAPERVLADIAAKRRMLERVENQVRRVGWHLADTWVLREAASSYADHADYRPEWRP